MIIMVPLREYGSLNIRLINLEKCNLFVLLRHMIKCIWTFRRKRCMTPSMKADRHFESVWQMKLRMSMIQLNLIFIKNLKEHLKCIQLTFS